MTTPITPAELRRLLAEALLGPWRATGEFITTPGEAPVFVHYKEDAALIAAAVNALAGLLDRIEALEAANATLKELLALPGGIDDPEAESVVARGGIRVGFRAPLQDLLATKPPAE